MITTLEKVAVLSKFQCCYAELAGSVATKLGKYKLCDLKSEIRNMKLARAYMLRIHNYTTLTAENTFGALFTFIRFDSTKITITITINDVAYTLSDSSLDLPGIISYFDNLFSNAGFSTVLFNTNGLIIYSTDEELIDAEVTVSLLPLTDGRFTQRNEVSYTEYLSESTDIILDNLNCLNREEICGIINQTCCILDKYCTN